MGIRPSYFNLVGRGLTKLLFAVFGGIGAAGDSMVWSFAFIGIPALLVLSV